MASNRSSSDVDKGSLVFGIESCQDLWDKLEREFERLKKTDARFEAIDHALNFAVTAWHLREWVWADMKGMHDLKARLAKEIECQPADFKYLKFEEYVLQECPDLRHCRKIALAVKHVRVEYERGDTDVSTLVSTTPDAPLFESTGRIMLRSVAKIVVDDERFPVVEVFDRVVDFWERLIFCNKIGADSAEDLELLRAHDLDTGQGAK